MTNATGAALVLLLAALTLPVSRAVEDTWDYSVQVDSVVEDSPPKITLSWPQDTNGPPASYTVYRKTPAATSWGLGTPLAGSATTYIDTRVALGRAYEYRIVKAAASYTGYGYIQAGIDIPLVEDRGTVVLMVDHTFAASLAVELARLQQDLVGDGWTVLRHDVGRTDSVVSVKNIIKAEYEADPGRVRAVFLFGHVPVPYSGQLNPDKHSDHIGAWPADVYYGDMHGNWTDSSVNFHQTLNTDPAAAARLTNIPGDGKFDQSTIPAAVELEVGRVDLAGLPGHPGASGAPTLPGEAELLRQYLNKDHNFRHRLLNVPRRAVVDDDFGVRGGEAFSASGYRNFAPLVGAENTANLSRPAEDTPSRRVSPFAAQGYLLAYDCGPGSYQTITRSGIAGPARGTNTGDRVSPNPPAVFTLIFGSWFGDWDNEDNLMRSILAAPMYSLATAWSGRPHWFVHPLGLGETIGYTARLTQNNTGLYQNEINLSANLVHIALMGDPTLRLYPVAPGGEPSGATTTAGATLAWAPSPDRVVGYHVYRALTADTKFTRLTSAPTPNASFVDSHPVPGATYMVRAVKLETTPSGSYYSASQGKFWTAETFQTQATNRPWGVQPMGNGRPATNHPWTAWSVAAQFQHMKKSILLPLFLGLVLAGCSRTETDSQKISATDKKSDPVRTAYDDKAIAAAQTDAAVAATPAPTASNDAMADLPKAPKDSSPMMANSSSSSAAPAVDSMTPPIAATLAAPAAPPTAVEPDQVAAIATKDAPSPASEVESTAQPDISARLVEWKLTPDDIKSEFESSQRVVRSRPAGAGEPTGPMDTVLVTQVNTKLQGDTDTSALKIVVSADQGIVTLDGSAESLQQIGKAVALALDTDGVIQAISTIKLETSP